MTQTLEDPWQVSEHDFPWAGTTAQKLKFLLNYAVLAPSVYNAQPWRFKISGGEVDLYVDRSRALPASDPGDRELVMSCGAALHHLRTAIQHYGYEPVVRTYPSFDEPDLLAFVGIGRLRDPTLQEHRLFMNIKKRRTNRMPFEKRPVSPLLLRRLEAAARSEGAQLHVISDPTEKACLAELIAEGDQIQYMNKQFRQELATWTHPNRGASRDGLPGYAYGNGDFVSYVRPFLVRTFDRGNGQAAQDRQLAEGSPVLMVLSTQADHPPAWLAAGQALSLLLLTASDYDLSASFLNQPLEVAHLRPRVASLIGTTAHPQLVLRLGYGPAVKPTPRRPVHEVMIHYGGA